MESHNDKMLFKDLIHLKFKHSEQRNRQCSVICCATEPGLSLSPQAAVRLSLACHLAHGLLSSQNTGTQFVIMLGGKSKSEHFKTTIHAH